MASEYPNSDVHFAGLISAASAAADAQQRELGKRKRGEENAYHPVPIAIAPDLNQYHDPLKGPTLSNSAAVLFREPSEKSKKYSRPPLGKVFTSLELAPDSFLKLQSAAKDYMLNDEHPDRKDVVGHKKQSGNNDQAKLKLYQCVEEFLQQDNNGEIYFGHLANTSDSDVPIRTFFWPEDRSRIIKLLMPLLRKMVTNERQRLYAAESRRSDTKKTGSEEPIDHQEHQSPILMPEIDPSLQPEEDHDGLEATTLATVSMSVPSVPANSEDSTINLLVNIMSTVADESKQMEPEFVLTIDQSESFEKCMEELADRAGTDQNRLQTKALLAAGLTNITTEEEWVSCCRTVSSTPWMNRRVLLVVELG